MRRTAVQKAAHAKTARTTRRVAGDGPDSEIAGAVFRPYDDDLAGGLLEMYRTFEPKGAYQGLPPYKEEVTRDWLSTLTSDPDNTNFVLCGTKRVIAHAALVHYPRLLHQQEIVIFVHQDYQRRGLGRQLLMSTMNWACCHCHLQSVWLWVNWHNLPARHMYASIGFEPLPSDLHDPDIEMVHRLSCAECRELDCPIYCAKLIGKLKSPA